jgi:RluA family pseudouridine synthase
MREFKVKNKKKNQPKIPIIYEDNDIIVIDKSAGMLSVSTDKEAKNTAYRMINDYVKSKFKFNKIWIVHRLDRDTSGIMLFAKNEKIKLKLQENWDKMAKLRSYIAVVEGRVNAPEQKITSWLKQTKTLLVYSSHKKGDGKIAVTNYKLLQASNKYSLLEITLETGRKNQIRVHMKDIGHPVAGDKKYGAVSDPLRRMALHANALTVKHPTTSEELKFESTVPNCFTKLFKSASSDKSGLQL